MQDKTTIDHLIEALDKTTAGLHHNLLGGLPFDIGQLEINDKEVSYIG